MTEPLDDATLVAARAGDDVAFARLYRSLHPPLLRYLRVAAAEDPEDVAAEVWLEVAREIRRFDGDSAQLRSWVFTIARHRAIDAGRRRGRRPADLVADVPDGPARDDTPAAALESIDTAGALALIRRLPRDQAEAVMLRVVMGLEVADVARILGKRPGAVRVNAMRGLRRLQTLLAAEGLVTESVRPVTLRSD